MKAAIVGIAGPTLSDIEAELLVLHQPAGVILFARNIADPAQLAALTAALRRILPNGLLMVDQEGGRVARLRPPHWRGHPSAGALGALFDNDPARGLRAAFLTGTLIGADCIATGFDVVTAPVLDRRIPGAHDVVGDRSFGADPQMVARLGRAFAKGLLSAGVQPVAKHAPGHGRACVDSHFALPAVAGPTAEMESDILPFALNAGLPWAMTAHIHYPDLDDRPATLSAKVIERVIRGRIGFGGVVVSDDLAMEALSGTPAERATAALAAGCDLALYCAGDSEANRLLLEACPEPTPQAFTRLAAARAMSTKARRPLDPGALAVERERLL